MIKMPGNVPLNTTKEVRDTVTRRGTLWTDIILCAVYTVLILAGLYSKVFTIAALLTAVVAFLVLPLENVIGQMMYLVAFVTIFKMSVGSTSFFTYLVMFVVLLNILRRPRFRSTELILLLFLVCSVLISVLLRGYMVVSVTIKFVTALMLLVTWKAADHGKELPNFIILLTLGILVSSLIVYSGFAKGIIQSYIKYDQLVITQGDAHYLSDITRFCGLNSDPNYYAINLCISLGGLLTLKDYGRMKSPVLVYGSVLALCFFALLTVSKSSLLMLAVVAVYLFVFLLQRRHYGWALLFMLVLAVAAVILFSGRVEVFNISFNRLLSETTDMDTLTTGRMHIWQRYLDYFAENPNALWFGAGLVSGFGIYGPAHNTYIESVSCLGLIGTALLIAFLAAVMRREKNKKFKRNFGNYFALMVIVIMYFFLSMLTWVELPIQLYLCYCFLNFDSTADVGIGQENRLTEGAKQ